jgi:hypothetical protein
MKLDSDTFEKWEEWGKKIHDDLFHKLIHPRQLFRAFNEMVKANAEHIAKCGGGDFFNFVAQGYITQVAMTIRRHSKNDDSVSFMRVLEQVKKCAPTIHIRSLSQATSHRSRLCGMAETDFRALF